METWEGWTTNGIFENFRISFETYHLDLVTYFASPVLTFDAKLKHSKVKLDIWKNREVLLYIEKRSYWYIKYAYKFWRKCFIKLLYYYKDIVRDIFLHRKIHIIMLVVFDAISQISR